MKKVLAIVLSVAMLLSVLSVNVFAEDDVLFDLSQHKSEIADYEAGKVAEGWCPSAITEWNGQQDTMDAFVEALRTEGAYIEVITKPNSEGGNVNGLLLMSYPLVDGSNKYTSAIFRTKLADTYENEDGKTVTTFDAAAAVAQYESTPHEDDVTGETMCSLDKLMTFGIDIPSGARIYNVMVKVAPPAPIIVTNGDNLPVECETIEAALAAVQENGTITLNQNITVGKQVELSKAGVTLDLGGNTLTASESFTYTDRTNLNDAHVVNISADNVKVCNGTIKSTVNNKHCLNVYRATGVVVEGLTLDHTNANAIKGGAPMVVGGSDVTVKYMLKTITGANSWYGINVDTYAGLTSSLKFDANAQMIFSGTKPFGIYLESTRSAESGDTVNVTFGENVSITAPEGVDFIAVFVNRVSTGANNITVTDPENAGLKDNGDGTYDVKTATTSSKNKITGCVYLNEDYHALIVNGRFIAQPHVDNGTGFCVACKGAINK